MWKQLVEAQWLGGRVLCQHNILGHIMPNSFLHVFRRHKALLSVDPATQRGLLPSALTLWMPNAEQEYSMIVELSYSARRVTKNKLVRCPESQEYSPRHISPPLSLDSRLSWVLDGYPCLTATLEPGQKIRFPLEPIFNPDHLSFAVTIVRKRDAKCKRIFQFPSPSEEFFGIVYADSIDQQQSTAAVLFDCPDASELARRRISYLSRCECGLQVHLGIVRGTDAHAAECVEIYSYSDTGEGHARFDEGIRDTLLRIEHVGIWF